MRHHRLESQTAATRSRSGRWAVRSQVWGDQPPLLGIRWGERFGRDLRGRRSQRWPESPRPGPGCELGPVPDPNSRKRIHPGRVRRPAPTLAHTRLSRAEDEYPWNKRRLTKVPERLMTRVVPAASLPPVTASARDPPSLLASRWRSPSSAGPALSRQTPQRRGAGPESVLPR